MSKDKEFLTSEELLVRVEQFDRYAQFASRLFAAEYFSSLFKLQIIKRLEIMQNEPDYVSKISQIIEQLEGKQREVLILCLRYCLFYVVTVGDRLMSTDSN